MKRSHIKWVGGIAVAALLLFVIWLMASSPHKRIVVLLPSRDNPFWVEIRSGIEEEKAALGSNYDVQIVTSELDAGDQVNQLRDALIRNVDGVVVGIADSRAPAPVIAQLNKKDIPVVLIDTPLDANAAAAADARPSAFIGSDNRQGGLLAAQAFARVLANTPGPKRVLLIKGSYVHKSAIDRAEGFVRGAKGHFEVVEREGEWSRQKAVEITSSLVPREHIVGIFASNDDMALGAVAALDNLRLPARNRPLVIGFDATKEGREAIAQGKMYGSIAQQTKMLGQQGLIRLVDVLNHRPVRAEQLVPVTLVTK
jgi:ABC-type sugar transport system substrate-binding protein